MIGQRRRESVCFIHTQNKTTTLHEHIGGANTCKAGQMGYWADVGAKRERERERERE